MLKTFICIASGPSLIRADCLLAACSGHPIIAVNSTWRLVPECHYIYAGDLSWWKHNFHCISVPAEHWTCSMTAADRYGVNLFHPVRRGAFNSGMRAIQFAVYQGAQRIILLGYDCSLENGTHWHGDHPAKMHNPLPGEVARWQKDFSTLAAELSGVEIINCSRRTALTCFPQQSPESIFHA